MKAKTVPGILLMAVLTIILQGGRDSGRARLPDSVGRGTLYVVEQSDPNDIDSRRLHLIQDGRDSVRSDDERIVFARDAPGVWMNGGSHLTIHSPKEDVTFQSPCGEYTNGYSLSPTGRYGVCASADAAYKLFKVGNPPSGVRVLPVKAALNTWDEIAFIDDEKVAVIEVDTACPVPHGPCLMFSPAGLIIVDRSGRIIKRGGCMDSVTTGNHAIAYGRVVDGDKAQYSKDGETWMDGKLETFDGEDRLLIIDADNNLRIEDGPILARNAIVAKWAP